MRAAQRLLASVKSARFLEPHSPTGLTGLATHPSPRSTLLALYTGTLDVLQNAPESSVYRQSTEALTRHRLEIIAAVKPDGYEEWLKKIGEQLESKPGAYKMMKTSAGMVVVPPRKTDVDPRSKAAEWDGRGQPPALTEGPRPEAEVFGGRISAEPRELESEDLEASAVLEEESESADEDFSELESEVAKRPAEATELEAEPQLTADQISELESQIGAGLIEEVIQVAEGELQLATVMVQAKVWEELQEQAPEGQWTYFERAQKP